MQLKPTTLIGIIVSIVTGLTVGVLWHLKATEGGAQIGAQTLSAALREVQANYVHDVSEAQLIDFAISGMMSGLDEHSSYLNRRDYADLEASTTGEFGGIGIELGLVDDYFTVITPLDNTPAQRAGVRAGDRITALDGDSLRHKTMTDVVRILRGEPGSKVSLRIRREDQPQPLTFDLRREAIKVSSVRSRMLAPGFGYVRISSFQTNTAQDLNDALLAMRNDHIEVLEGIVLDLRNNPGGTLVSSVEVVDLFLERGLIVSTKGRLKTSDTKYRASRGDELDGAPIVVLINGGSASAAEVVAGALQDHDRATLMGSVSYGKGSVQSVVPLGSEQALKITTAHYYTPNGRNIHQTGIEPDISVDLNDDELLAAALDTLRTQTQNLSQLDVPNRATETLASPSAK